MLSESTGVWVKRERKCQWRSGNVWAGPCITTLLYLYSRSLWFTKMSYYEEFQVRKWHLCGGGGSASTMSALKGSSSLFPLIAFSVAVVKRDTQGRKARGPLPDSQKSNQMTEQWVQTCNDSMQTDISGVNNNSKWKKSIASFRSPEIHWD